MPLKLYELADQYRLLIDKGLDTESGEIIEPDSEALFKRLDEIKDSIGNKAENIAKLFLELQGEAKVVETEITRLAKHKSRLESNSQWLKDYLLRELETAGLKEIKRPTVKITIRVNPPSVVVTDADAVLLAFKRHVPAVWEVDKNKVLKYYKEIGEEVDGIEIITDKKRIDIR